MKTPLKRIAVGFALTALLHAIATLSGATSLLENLGRGVVAVRTSGTDVFVSWRVLGTDPADIAFNLYRSTNGGSPVLLNGAPITGATNHTDATANLTLPNAYFVRSIVFGVEQPPSAAYLLAANSPQQQYLRVPLQRPANGVTPINEGYSYIPNDTSAGDLDGDGEYELVLKWEPSNARDSSQDGYTGNTYFDAYKLDGTRLWRIDLGVNVRAGPHDTPFIVYDFDGDGRAEVVMRTAAGSRDGLGNFVADPAKFFGPFPSEPFSHTTDYRNTAGRALVGPEFLTIFDGLTGAELASTKFLPARHPDTDFPTSTQLQSIWGDTSGNRQGRFYPPGAAYLDGQRPSIVMGRGYASGQGGHPGRIAIAAWNWRDGQITPQWQFDSRGHPNEAQISGQGAHNASVADLDGDGKDDIVYGQLWVRSDGTLMRTGWGHGDALHVSNMDPDRPGQQVFMPHESPGSYGPNALSYEQGTTGALIFGVQASGDIGRGVAADVDPRFRGYEMWGSGGTGGLYNAQHFVPNAVLGPRGAQVAATKPNSINHAVWWDGDLLRELLDGTTISKWNWTTESTNSVLTTSGIASNNGTKSNPCLQADLFGDWREEVIWRETTNDAIRIYTTTIPTTHRLYTLMHDRQYRVAIAWQNVGYNQPPHPSFFLGHDMAPAPTPDIVTSLSTLLGPPPPVFTAITIDAGASATDFITNDTTLVLHGTATPETTVTLTRLGTGVIGSAPVNAAGNWSFDYTGTTLPHGQVSFTGTATDASANTGAPSAAFNVTIDTVAPAAPAITDISSTSTLHFSGTAEAGSTVTVFRNGFGAIGTAIASASGNWSLDYAGPPLAPGAYSFSAHATDIAGNTGPQSAASSVDTTIATPTISALANDTGPSATDGITSDNTLAFSGSAGAGNTVTLTRVDAGTIGTTTAEAGGDWTFDYTGTVLADGTYFFTAKASTGGGTFSPSSAAMVVVVDTAAPVVTSVNRLNPSAASSASETITFRATFTESVASVDAADFNPVFGGGLSGTITDIAAAGASAFDVTLSLSGEGSVRLDVNAGGIHDLAGNALAVAFTAGQTYTRSLTGNGVWIQPESGGLWSANANWENGIVASGVGTTADFNSLDAAEEILVRLDAPRTVGNLLFGDTDITSPGSWLIDNNGALANVLTLGVSAGSPTVQVNPLGLGATATVAARVAGNQGLNKLGTGTLVFTGANTLTGTHNISAGTLRIGPGGSQSAGTVNVSAGGGTLEIAGGTFTATGTTTVNGGGGSLIVNSGTGTFAAVNTNNSANGLIRVNGGSFSAASINLPRSSDGTPSFDFGFVVTGGTALVSGNVGIGTNNSWGSMAISGGSLTINGIITLGNQQSGGRGGQMRVTGGTFMSTNAATGILMSRNNGTNTNNVSTATFSGGTSFVERFTLGFDAAVTAGSATINVNGGTLHLGSGGIVKNGAASFVTNLNLSSGTVGAKANWSTALPINLPGGGNIVFKTASALDEPFNIALNGALSGAGGFTKTGGGQLTLGGANTFTGAIALNAGTLRITGSLAGGAAINLNGGALTGAGTINKPVVLNVGATIAPDDTSSFALGGASLTWNGGGRVAVNLGASGVSGNLALTGALLKGTAGTYEIALTAGAGFAAGNVYTIATFGSTTFSAADFTATGVPAGYKAFFSVNGTSLQLTVKAITTIALGNLTQFYDGTPRIPTTVTDPAGLGVAFTYNGSGTPPTLPGSYAVVATIEDPVYWGTTTGTLVVTTTAVVRHAPNIVGSVDGSVHVLLAENVTLRGDLSHDLLVPGTPEVRADATATFVGVQDASGAEDPTNRRVTLAEASVLRYVVRRVDPVTMPVVTPPQPPAGTRDVVINNPSQSAGDFATLRNLTLGGGAGLVAVPPGVYGNFTANGASGFVLGDAGSTSPAIYQLQQLSLGGSSSLQVVGPVLLKLASGVTLNATAGSPAEPRWLNLQVASGDVTLNTGATLHGEVIAPNGAVTIREAATLNGNISAAQLTINESGLLHETEL